MNSTSATLGWAGSRSRQESLRDWGLQDIVPGSRIPRIIHVIFRGSTPPRKVAANLERIRAMNPGWELRLYSDAQCLAWLEARCGEQIRRAYLSIDPRYGAARADLFRYLLLYHEGGCYLDSKSSTGRPLDEVLKPGDQYLLSKWRNGPGERFEGWSLENEALSDAGIADGEFQQWFILAARGHPFLRAVVLKVLDNIGAYRPDRMGTGFWGLMGVGRGGVVNLTGPVPYTLTIEALRQRYAHRVVDSEADLGLVYSIFMNNPSNTDGSVEHFGLFGGHYSLLQVPIVKLNRYRALRWWLYRHTIDLRVRLSLRTRLARLLRGWRERKA